MRKPLVNAAAASSRPWCREGVCVRVCARVFVCVCAKGKLKCLCKRLGFLTGWQGEEDGEV